MLVFDDGAPDTRQIPVDALARAYRNALAAARGTRPAWAMAIRAAAAELRAALSNMLNIDRGLITTPDNICLTRGSQMAIYLAARILAGPGDTVVMEELSYPPAREAFRFAGAEVVPFRSMRRACGWMNWKKSAARSGCAPSMSRRITISRPRC